MSEFEAAQTNETETPWYVQLPDGEVRTMTLDELVQSFEAGMIDERANVLQMGETEWRTLGEVAGLGEDEDEEEQVDVEDDMHHGQNGYANGQNGYANGQNGYANGQNGYANGHAAVSGFAPASYAPAPAASAWPEQPPQAATSWPPVAQPIMNGSYGSAPPASSAYSPRPMAGQYNTIPAQRLPGNYDLQAIADARSTAPVAFDMDDDDAMSFRRRKRSRALPTMFALAALGGLGFAGFHYAPMFGLLRGSPPVAAAMPPPAPAPPPPADPIPAAQPDPTPPAPSTVPAADNRLSDATKQALADADKKHDAKQKAVHEKHQQQAADAPHRSSGKHGKAGSPFSKGGDRYDPLNSSL